MKVTTAFEGGEAMARQLAALPDAVSRQRVVYALTKAAEPIRELAEDRAPRDRNAKDPHLADHIVIGVVSKRSLEARGRDTETVVEVGPAAGEGGDDFFYGRFQEFEFGGMLYAAQPFMRPAFDEGAPEALEILGDELWWAIRRGISPARDF